MHITDTLADTLKEFDQPYKIITKISYSWFDVQLCFLYISLFKKLTGYEISDLLKKSCTFTLL